MQAPITTLPIAKPHTRHSYSEIFSELQSLISYLKKETKELEETSFHKRREVAEKFNFLTTKMKAKLNSLELDTWAKRTQVTPVRNRVAEIQALTAQLSGEGSRVNYERDLDNLKYLFFELNEAVRLMNIELESSLFSNLDKHALRLEFENKDYLLSKTKREQIDSFIQEQMRESKSGSITIFVWSSNDEDFVIAGKRAQSTKHFLKSFVEIKVFKVFNMDKEPTLWEWVVDQEKYRIKKAYADHEFSDTREETIGWFLANTGGKNCLIILYE